MMPIYPAARTQGSMQAALNALRENQQGRQLNFAYMNQATAKDLADRQLAMIATHTLRADKAEAKASSGGGGTGGWGSIAGTVIGATVGGPAGAVVGSSIGGAVDQATSRGGGGGGGAQQINQGISSALDIYTEMQQFDVPDIQPYMSAQPEVFSMGLR